MASTYSTNLALELIGTGEQAGSWGSTTNTNLGTLIEQAISGYVTQAITDGADTTITIPNGATGVARNMYIECTGTLTANRNLIVPANKKLYAIYNNTTGGYSVTVKVSGQTGVSVANGKKLLLVSNGTDVVDAINYLNGTASGNPPWTSSTGAVTPSIGTTAQRPTGVEGYFRYNTSLSQFEGYYSGNWQAVGGGQMLGTAVTKAIFYNAQTIAENITIGATQNGFSVGPVTIDTGYAVTITSGGKWTISS